ncbi:MAG: hypothetical protein ABIP79_05445 [Chitinophagaceae bacterium]
MGKKLFTFFINSNLFIAGCAVVMVWQTNHLLLNDHSNNYFLFFVFFSTITSYSFHWYLTSESAILSPRIEWVQQNKPLHLVLFIIGIIGTGIFFFYLLNYWHWLLISALITFLYTAPKIPHRSFKALRKIAVGKTLFLAMVWMFVTTILPIEIAEQPWQNEFYFFIGHRFFLIYAICMLFDYRDREDDNISEIRSLISFLSEKNISLLFYLIISFFTVSTVLLAGYGISNLQIAVLLLPGAIVAALFNYSKKHFTDILYYFVLDGLMAFSSLLMLIAGI